jgi:hypothetical protein
MISLFAAYSIVACAIAGYILRLRHIDRGLRRRAAALATAHASETRASIDLRSAA